jgi:hypothetical protein
LVFPGICLNNREGSQRRYHETVPAETPHLPVVPHWKAGITCNGSIVPEQDGDQITLRCNECGSVVGTINAAILSALEQAIADAFVFHKIEEMDAPKVLTSVSEECQRGDCANCPGHYRLAGVRAEMIFCVHECHEAEQEPSSNN